MAIRAVAVEDECDAEILEQAVARMRFALAVDDDMRPFYAEFKRDPFIGPAIRRRPWLRPSAGPVAWEALVWAITEQLIESSRAAVIQRGWSAGGAASRSGAGEGPSAGRCATSRRRRGWPASRRPSWPRCDLSPARAIAMVKCAREVATGRADPADPADDARFERICEIGPWTLQCLGLFGRGEPDSLPAGDLAYVKLVGVAAGLGRRATVEEVEEFYAPLRAVPRPRGHSTR